MSNMASLTSKGGDIELSTNPIGQDDTRDTLALARLGKKSVLKVSQTLCPL